jgi:WD40 repeat protein/serine/threonine protein kinase
MQLATCPSRQQISSFLLGKMPEEMIDSVAEHIEGCPDCQQVSETLDSAVDTFVSQLQQPAEIGALAVTPDCQRMMSQAEGIFNSAASHGPALATPPPELGQVREYKLLEKLGEGGMGTVYKARHAKLKKVVALKVLPADRMQNEQAVARFQREMEAVGRLNHPNIVGATDAGEHDGVHFLVMEYVDGIDLSNLVKNGGPLPIADACELIRQAAIGLQDAHENGMVHRDIKPSNIMLTIAGRSSQATVKILDLGLALLQDESVEVVRELTTAGQAMGTVDYMAPEQAGDSHEVDIRADIYSLGGTLYKLLSGHAPFSGEKYSTHLKKLLAVINDPVPPIRQQRSDIPAELAAVLDRMLAKQPADRFATPADVATALAPFAAGSDLSALVASRSDAQGKAAGSQPNNTAAHLSSHSSETTPTVAAPAPSSRLPAATDVEATIEHAARPLAARPPTRTRTLIAIAAAAAAFLILGVVVIIIKNKQGEEVARVVLPDGQSAEIEQDGKRTVVGDAATKQPDVVTPAQIEPVPERPDPPIKVGPLVPRPTPLELNITAEPVALKSGDSLSRTAWVARPVPIPGVVSWTIEGTNHRESVTALASSPDDKLIASAGRDGVIRIWDVQTASIVKMLLGHGGDVPSLSWSPDGRYIASASSDKTSRIWDVDSGRLAHTFATPNNTSVEVTVAWSPKGAVLAYNAGSGIRLWDPQAQSEEKLNIHGAGDTNKVTALAWSPDGNILASGSTNKSVRLWNQQTKEVQAVLQHDARITALAWSPDGAILAATTYGGETKFWSADLGKCVGRFPESHYSGFAWSPDGRSFINVLDHHKCQVWDTEQWKQLSTGFAGETNNLLWSSDGKTIFCGNSRGQVVAYDVQKTKPPTAFSVHCQRSSDVAWSPTGRFVAMSYLYANAPVLIWNAATGEVVKSLPVGNSRLAWTPNGDSLACTSGGIQIFDVETGKKTSHLKVSIPNCTSIAYSPDGNYFATGHEDKTVRIWDIASQQVLHTLDGHTWSVNRVKWSPDGTKLVSSGGNTHCWDTRTGALLEGDAAKTLTTQDPRLSPDTKRMATLENGLVRIVEAESNNPEAAVMTLPGGHHLAISATGHYRGSEGVEQQIRYVVLTDDGSQHTLTPGEFSA